MKRTLIWLLTVIMVLTSVPVTSHATETETDPKVYVDVRKNGTAGFTLGADYSLEGSVITATKTSANPNIVALTGLESSIRPLVIQMEIASKESGNGQRHFNIYWNDGSKEFSLVNIDKCKVWQFAEYPQDDNMDGWKVTSDVDTYSKFAMVIGEDNTVTYYLDGVSSGAISRTDGVDSYGALKNLYIRYNSNGVGTVYIKDLKVFEGDAPNYDYTETSGNVAYAVSQSDGTAPVVDFTDKSDETFKTFKTQVFTRGELSKVEVGTNASVYLKSAANTEAQSTVENKLQEEAFAGYTCGSVFDISLLKKLGEETEVQVAASVIDGSAFSVPVTVSIPEALQKTDRAFKVLEIKEGAVTEITCEINSDGTAINIQADMTSTYAIAYMDAASQETVPKVYVDVLNKGTEGFTLGADYTLNGSVITATKTDENPNIIELTGLENSARPLIIEMEIASKESGTGQRNFNIYWNAGGWTEFSLVNIDKCNICNFAKWPQADSMNGWQITAEEGQYSKFKMVLGIDDTVTYYLDDKESDELPIPEDYLAKGELKNLYFRYNSNGAGTIYIKDLKIYEGEAPAVIVENPVSSGNAPVIAYKDKDKVADVLLGTEEVEKAVISMEVSDEFGISEEHKVAVDNALAGNSLGQLFSMNLQKQIGTDQAEQVTTTDEAIELVLTIPESLKNTEKLVERTYQLIRVSADGNAEIIESDYQAVTGTAGTLSFKTNQFSTYAIIYKDETYVIGDKVFMNTSTKEGIQGVFRSDSGKLTLIKTEESGDYYFEMADSDHFHYIREDIVNPTRFMVVQTKIAWEEAIPKTVFRWRDSNSRKDINFISFTTEGKIKLTKDDVNSYESIGNLSSDPNTYTNIAIVIDWNTKLADVYVDDMETPIYTNWQLPDQIDNVKLASADQFSFGMSGTNGNGKLLIKDWCVYEGDKPKETKDLEVIGDKLYLNTIATGLKDLVIDKAGNEIAWETDHIVMKAASDNAAILSSTLPYVSNYMVVRMSLGWSGSFPNAGVDYVDKNAVTDSLIKLDSATRSIVVGSETIVSNLAENEYKDIALIINWDKQRADVYLAGELVKENVQFATAGDEIELNSVSKIRPVLYAGNEAGAGLLIKDWVIYESKSLKEITADTAETEKPEISTDNEEALSVLGNNIAMAVDSDKIYYGGEKHEAGASAFEKDGVAYFPVNAIAQALGKDAASITASATFDGEKYLSVEDLAMLATDKTVTYADRGFVVIGDTFTDDETARIEVLHYLLYERPTQSDIYELFENKTASEAHPRIVMDADMCAQIKENYKNNVTVKAWGDEIIASADAMLKQEAPKYQISGSNNILEVSREVLKRAETISMAYVLTKEQKYVDALYKVYYAAGEFPNWDHKHFLDTAELINAFAIGYDWMYDAWTDDQRTYIESTMYNMGLRVGLEAYTGKIPGYYTWWAYSDMNWNVVCNGSITNGALALLDNKLYKADSLRAAEIGIRGVEVMLDSFYPSGAWSEGPMYWGYTMSYVSYMLSSLDATFGTDFNLSNAPALDKTLNYYLATDGPVGMNNFHDTQGTDHMTSQPLMWLSYKYDMPGAMNIRKSNIETGSSGLTVRDVIFYNPNEATANQDYTLDYYMEETELVSLRESFEDFESTWISYHAGASERSHSHLDTGTYVVHMLGERWAIDLGSDNYDLDNYRYGSYRTRTESHNLYVINPQKDSETYFGQNIRDENGEIIFVKAGIDESKAKGAYSVIDLTECYRRDVTSAMRGYMLGDDRRSVVIRDEITFKEADNEFYWFNNIPAGTTWEILDDKTIILTQNGQMVKFMIETNLSDYDVSVVEAKPLVLPTQDLEYTNEGVHKIQIHTAKASGDVYVQVKFIPLDDPNAEEEFDNIKLEEWSIEDGELSQLPVAPTLDAIYNEGMPLNFSKTKLIYEIAVVFDATEIPTITADAPDDCNVVITSAESFDEYTLIKVYWKDYPESFRTYRIKFRVMDELTDITLDGNTWDRLQVLNHFASAEPEEAHPATNVSDNDTQAESRWAASGEQWICLDLGSKKEFSAIGLSWWNGSARSYKFDIEISDDGENFTTVLKDQASGMKQDDYEIFVLPDSTSARYVRYRGYGSSANAWNSITEFAVLTQESDVKLPEEDMDTTVPSDSEEIEPSVPQISDEEETEEVTVDDKDKSILTVSQEANTPDTGDDSNFSMWILLLAIMGVFLGGFARQNNLCTKPENRRG